MAGDTFAMSLAIAYTEAPVWAFVDTLSANISFVAYVDDTQLQGIGSARDIENLFVPAMKRLGAVLTSELKGFVNTEKAETAGSNAATVALVRHHAGLPAAGPSTPLKRNMGVDYAPSRPRRALKRGSVMANRLKTPREKLANVEILRAMAGKHRTQSLLFTNLLPSMAYGVEVTDLSPTELRTRESLAL